MVGRHPRILEVAVAAYPCAVMGERACAFVVTSDARPLLLSELLDYLRKERMPTWQMPERLEMMDELPKSAGGKIMKNKLRDYVAAKVKAEAQSPARA
jgi:non-ribosomal peptide synthetase component E (peptide arylation enzyme)